MAGFALNLRVVLSHHGVGFDKVCCESYLESLFLVRLGLHCHDVECIGYQYSEVCTFVYTYTYTYVYTYLHTYVRTYVCLKIHVAGMYVASTIG